MRAAGLGNPGPTSTPPWRRGSVGPRRPSIPLSDTHDEKRSPGSSGEPARFEGAASVLARLSQAFLGAPRRSRVDRGRAGKRRDAVASASYPHESEGQALRLPASVDLTDVHRTASPGASPHVCTSRACMGSPLSLSTCEMVSKIRPCRGCLAPPVSPGDPGMRIRQSWVASVGLRHRRTGH